MRKKKAHRHVDNTPLTELSEQAFQGAMDKRKKSLDESLLDSARRGEDQDIQIAVVFLNRPGKPDSVVYATLEYGDGEGIRDAEDLLRNCERQGLLAAGETLSFRLCVARNLEPVPLDPECQ